MALAPGYELIPASAYDNLPSDAAEQFLALAAVAEAGLASGKAAGEEEDNLRKRFMGELAAAADELGAGSLPEVPRGILTHSEWDGFCAALGGIKARLRLRSRRISQKDSVQLDRVTRARIEQEVDQLRILLDRADLSEKKKQALRNKLDEFVEELHKRRMSFAKLAAVAAAVAGTLGGSSVALANAPEAMETVGRILHWVGEAKALEEEEQLLLSPPAKALPAPADEELPPEEIA